MWARTPCRTSSKAAQRSPFFATWQPTTSVTQWSTAPKNQHQPSVPVQNHAASVPHSSPDRSRHYALSAGRLGKWDIRHGPKWDMFNGH